MALRLYDKKMKKVMRELITQGNQKQMQIMFNDIIKASREEFYEDNLPTLTSYIHKMVLESFSEWILETEYEYGIGLDDVEYLLKKTCEEYVDGLKKRVREQDPLLKKAKQAVYLGNPNEKT